LLPNPAFILVQQVGGNNVPSNDSLNGSAATPQTVVAFALKPVEYSVPLFENAL